MALTLTYTTTQSDVPQTHTETTANDLKYFISGIRTTIKTAKIEGISEGTAASDNSCLQLFMQCESLTSIDVSSFDTSNITNMTQMFAGCNSLTSIDVSNFDISNVTQMGWMFQSCRDLTTIYCNNDWNLPTITSSSSMFTSCPNLVGAVPYDSTQIDITMANPTTGYFTYKLNTDTYIDELALMEVFTLMKEADAEKLDAVYATGTVMGAVRVSYDSTTGTLNIYTED